MALTAEDIDRLPLSPDMRAKYAAKIGVPYGAAPQPTPSVMLPAAPPPVSAAPPMAPAPPVMPMMTPAAPPAPAPQAGMADQFGAWMHDQAAPPVSMPGPLASMPPKQVTPLPAPGAGVLPAAPKPSAMPLPAPAPAANTIAPVVVDNAPMPQGGPLPLQAPEPPDPTLYHGQDPLTFGKTPTERGLEIAQGQAMYGQGEYAKRAAEVDVRLAGDFDKQAGQIAADADAKAREAEDRAKNRKKFLDRFNLETEQQIEQYSNAKIDPDRYWSGGAGVGNAISAVIGAFVSGVAGYLDPSKDYVRQFADRIEGKISQDIAVQKANIEQKGAGLAARRGLYGQYLQQFGTEDAADAMSHETYLRKVKSQVDAYAAKAANDKQKTNAQALSLAIDDDIKKWALGRKASGERLVDDYARMKAQQAAQAAAQAAAAAGADLRKRNELVFKAQLSVAEERAKKIGGTPLVLSSPRTLANGTVIPAGSAIVLSKGGELDMEGTEAAQAAGVTVNIPVTQADGRVAYKAVPVAKAGHTEVAKQASGAAKALGAIDRMAKAAAMPGPWVGKKYREYQAGLADYTTFYGVANNMGAISKEEGERVAKTTVPIPTWGAGYMTDSEEEQLAAQKVAISNAVKATATSFGPGAVAGPAPLPLQAPATPGGK